MEFDWDTEQEDRFARSLSFARERLAGTRDAFDRDRWQACGDFGVQGLCLPQARGGLGLDARGTAHVLEALGRGTADLGLLFSAAAHLFACAVPIEAFADPSIAAELVPALASGAKIGANAMTEPGAGSDTQRLATTAVRDGEHYVLNGDKAFVTNAPVADVFVVYATTEPSHGYLGQTAFIVHRDQPGVHVGAPMDKVGLRASPIGSVYFEDCRVPARHRLGAEGSGAKVFAHSMAWERACLFGIYVGAMQRQLDGVVEHARARKQFGKPIARFQAVSHRVADMKLRLESARLLLYHACWQHDRQGDATLAISLAKLAVSEAAVQSGLDAIQIHGGAGLMSETGVELGLRDALASTVFSGTSEIQRNLIARRLGL